MEVHQTKKINKNTIPEQYDPIVSDADGMETENFDSELLDVEEVSIDQLLKGPSDISQINDADSYAETETEYAAWCPLCNDYTIFVDGICTACGFTKTTSKHKQVNDSSTEEEQDLLEVLDTYREDDLDGLDPYNVYQDEEDDT